jgi:outer membrane lipoprotein-sorting protein
VTRRFVLAALVLFPAALGADEGSAERIVRRMMEHDAFGAEGARTKMRMVVTSRTGAVRERSIDWISRKDGDVVRSVVRFRAPADVAGTAFLLVQRGASADEQYVYLPALRRVRRILGRERQGSFMGSDVSYADLERRDPSAAVYRQRGDETVGGHACYVIESTPKPGREADHPYAKIVMWIRKSDHVALRIQFMDAQGRLEKTLFARRIQTIEGRPVVVESRMENARTGSVTSLFIDEIHFVDVPMDEFTERALE